MAFVIAEHSSLLIANVWLKSQKSFYLYNAACVLLDKYPLCHMLASVECCLLFLFWKKSDHI